MVLFLRKFCFVGELLTSRSSILIVLGFHARPVAFDLRVLTVLNRNAVFLFPVTSPTDLGQAERVIPGGVLDQPKFQHHPLLQAQEERSAARASIAAAAAF